MKAAARHDRDKRKNYKKCTRNQMKYEKAFKKEKVYRASERSDSNIRSLFNLKAKHLTMKLRAGCIYTLVVVVVAISLSLCLREGEKEAYARAAYENEGKLQTRASLEIEKTP